MARDRIAIGTKEIYLATMEPASVGPRCIGQIFSAATEMNSSSLKLHRLLRVAVQARCLLTWTAALSFLGQAKLSGLSLVTTGREISCPPSRKAIEILGKALFLRQN
jgi:hypothetical protein